MLEPVRTLGIDPGTAHVAAFIVDGIAAPFSFVASEIYSVGRDIELATPRVSPSGRVKTHRHEVTDEDLSELAAQIVALVLEHRPDIVRVERMTHVHAGTAFGALADLTRSQWVGGFLAGAVAAHAVVQSVSSRRWRNQLRRACDGPDYRQQLAASVDIWPEASGKDMAHIRDAAGVAIYRPDEVRKTTSARRAHRDTARSNRARQQTRDERRALLQAHGCTCARNHRKDCLGVAWASVTA